jgi:glucosylceramidase
MSPLCTGTQLLVLYTVVAAIATRTAAVDPTVDIYTSSAAGERLQKLSAAAWKLLPASAVSPCPADAFCIGRQAPRRQVIDGFGGTFNRAGARLLNSLPNATQEALLATFFDPVVGAGFTLGKVPIAANDFAVPTWYSYEERPGTFSLDVDLRGPDALVPYIRRAQRSMAGRTLRLQATMDYPPAWMLNTSTPLPNATVNIPAYEALAHYYLNVTTTLAENGVNVEYLSMFNEPEESYCKMTVAQLHTLLVDYVGPLFRFMPGAPKLTWGEQYGRVVTRNNYPALMNMSGTRQYTDILFYHGYDCTWTCAGGGGNTTCPGLDDAMKAIAEYKQMYPNLTMWMTEVCYAVEFDNYPKGGAVCPTIPRIDFMDAFQWGRMLMGDLRAGASGWIYWNLLLDPSGGPFLVSEDHNDPKNNYQQPLVVVDTAAGTFTPTACYFVMAHFSRFLPPGMALLDVAPPVAARADGLQLMAFADAAFSNVVVVAMNDSPQPQNVTVIIDGHIVMFTATAASFATVVVTLDAVGPAPPPSAPEDTHEGTWIGVIVGAGVAGLLIFGCIQWRRRHARRRHQALESKDLDTENLPV